jgi:uncharacterized membrane protein
MCPNPLQAVPLWDANRESGMKAKKIGERRKTLRVRIARRLISGIAVLIPLGITLFVLSVLFKATVGVSAAFLGLFLGDLPRNVVIMLAVALSVGVVYIAGALASHVIGRKVIALGEVLVAQIPVVKTIYATSKQVIEMFQGRPDSQSQKVVLVEFPTPGLKAFGFLTGHITMPDATECYKIFIPTAPNPTSGYFQLVPISRCEVLDLSTEEALRLIISVGILAPPSLQASMTSATAAYVPGEDKVT